MHIHELIVITLVKCGQMNLQKCENVQRLKNLKKYVSKNHVSGERNVPIKAVVTITSTSPSNSS